MLMVTMITCLIIGTVLASFLVLISRRYNMTIRSAAWNAAMPVLEAGIEEGLFAEGPPEMLAAWVLATVDGLVLQWVIAPEEIDLRALGSLVSERLLQGLRLPASQ